MRFERPLVLQEKYSSSSDEEDGLSGRELVLEAPPPTTSSQYPIHVLRATSSGSILNEYCCDNRHGSYRTFSTISGAASLNSLQNDKTTSLDDDEIFEDDIADNFLDEMLQAFGSNGTWDDIATRSGTFEQPEKSCLDFAMCPYSQPARILDDADSLESGFSGLRRQNIGSFETTESNMSRTSNIHLLPTNSSNQADAIHPRNLDSIETAESAISGTNNTQSLTDTAKQPDETRQERADPLIYPYRTSRHQVSDGSGGSSIDLTVSSDTEDFDAEVAVEVQLLDSQLLDGQFPEIEENNQSQEDSVQSKGIPMYRQRKTLIGLIFATAGLVMIVGISAGIEGTHRNNTLAAARIIAAAELNPSQTPSMQPSREPSAVPSDNPSSSPSYVPSGKPSSMPSLFPSLSPTSTPSVSRSGIPTATPSSQPSRFPTLSPSRMPSTSPTASPSFLPTIFSSSSPSSIPSVMYSSSPTSTPSISPSSMPSPNPTASPTSMPSTSSPSAAPTLSASGSPSSSTMTPTISSSRKPSAQPQQAALSSIPSQLAASVSRTATPTTEFHTFPPA